MESTFTSFYCRAQEFTSCWAPHCKRWLVIYYKCGQMSVPRHILKVCHFQLLFLWVTIAPWGKGSATGWKLSSERGKVHCVRGCPTQLPAALFNKICPLFFFFELYPFPDLLNQDLKRLGPLVILNLPQVGTTTLDGCQNLFHLQSSVILGPISRSCAFAACLAICSLRTYSDSKGWKCELNISLKIE